MSKNESENEPPNGGITFAVWKRAPLDWSLWLIGWTLVKASDRLVVLGLALMDGALHRINARGGLGE